MPAISLSNEYTGTVAAVAGVTSTIIQDRFPGRVVLSPEEVAEVWRGSRSRKAVGAIRKRLSRGTLIPGLRKNGGRWEVPVEGLVKAIERLTAGGDEDEEEEDDQPIHPQSAPPSGTRKRAIGPRMSDSVGFWSEVFAAIDLLEADRVRAELGATVMGWKWITPVEHKAMADQVLSDPPDKTYTDDEVAKRKTRCFSGVSCDFVSGRLFPSRIFSAHAAKIIPGVARGYRAG